MAPVTSFPEQPSGNPWVGAIGACQADGVRRGFSQVDVFTSDPFLGNPVAVVLDGAGVTTDEMQRVACWTNLSETTFVLPPTDPGADYLVRIFTTDVELPFAGHPTLGTCHAWLEAGGVPADPDRIVQQCGVGLVPVRRDQDRLAFAAPPLVRSGPVEEETVARALGVLGVERDEVVDVAWADNGPGWVAVLLADAAAVLALTPDLGSAPPISLGVAGPHPTGSECAWEVRAFFAAGGRGAEDPVTGSLNASLATWLLGTGRASAPYVAGQGTAIGRRGRVHVDRDDDGTIWVGGATTTRVAGTVEL